MDFTSIDSYAPDLNAGGLIRVQYAPAHWIATEFWDILRSSAGNHQNQVVFEPDRDWLTASLLPPQRAWGENSQRSPHGQYYEHTIAGNTAMLRPAVTALFERMEKVGFVLRIVDRNARPWLIGSPGQWLYFTAQAGTGNEAGLNAYEIQWQGLTSRRGAGYVPIA
jgi:hypothetical protein